nr:hypothetical protein [uncultured Duganella sp.]
MRHSKPTLCIEADFEPTWQKLQLVGTLGTQFQFGFAETDGVKGRLGRGGPVHAAIWAIASATASAIRTGRADGIASGAGASDADSTRVVSAASAAFSAASVDVDGRRCSA